MANLNVIVLTGRMTADPELRTIDNGAVVVNFSIAVQRGYKPAGSTIIPWIFWISSHGEKRRNLSATISKRAR